jgi:hypothetical protein
MANPFVLIERGYLYLENDQINDAMQALYDPEIIIDEEGRVTATVRAIPTEATILQVVDQLRPFLHPYADNAFTPQDVHGLIINIVLYDASLDETFGLDEDIPSWYHPRLLLEHIGEERGFQAGNKTHNDLSNHNNDNAYDASDDLYDMTIDQTQGHGPVTHILLWSSERVFPYFKQQLGLDFVLDSMTMERNSYLHSYLSSGFFRILNPHFVETLLEDGFSLLHQNVRGETPLHSLVYLSDLPFASLTDAEVKAHPQSQAVKRYRQFYRTMMLLFQDPNADMDIQNDTQRSVLQLLHEEHIQPLKYDDLYNWYALRDQNNAEAAAEEPERKVGLRRKNALEAYNITMGRPLAIERAKQQKLARALTGNMFLLNRSMNPGPPTFPSVSRPVGSIIEEMLGTNLRKGQAVVEKRQMNNTRRRKGNMQKELQSPTLNNTKRKQTMQSELLSRISRNNRSGGTRRGDTSHASQTHTPLHSRRKQRAKKTRR